MVILGFRGFDWVLGGLGGLDLGRLVWWLVMIGRGLWVVGGDCVHTGRKRGFVWVFWWEFGALCIWWEKSPREVV